MVSKALFWLCLFVCATPVGSGRGFVLSLSPPLLLFPFGRLFYGAAAFTNLWFRRLRRVVPPRCGIFTLNVLSGSNKVLWLNRHSIKNSSFFCY